MSFFSHLGKTVDNFSKPITHPEKMAGRLCSIFDSWEGIAKRNDLNIKYLLNHIAMIDFCYGYLHSGYSDYVNNCGGKINETNYYAEVCNNLWSEYRFFNKIFSRFMNNKSKYDKYLGVTSLTGQLYQNVWSGKDIKEIFFVLLNDYVSKKPNLTI